MSGQLKQLGIISQLVQQQGDLLKDVNRKVDILTEAMTRVAQLEERIGNSMRGTEKIEKDMDGLWTLIRKVEFDATKNDARLAAVEKAQGVDETRWSEVMRWAGPVLAALIGSGVISWGTARTVIPDILVPPAEMGALR